MSTKHQTLILFDLDGTAIDSHLGAQFSTQLLKALDDAAHRGYTISIATGRSWDHFFSLVEPLRSILAPCIISGGSQIVDVKNNQLLWEQSLTTAHIRGLNFIASKHRLPIAYNQGLVTHAAVTKISHSSPSIAYLLDIPDETVEGVLSEVSALGTIHPVITPAWGDDPRSVLHITHADANKGIATQHLIKMLDTNKKDVFAIGDGFNDLPMLKEAGKAIAIEGSVIANDPVISQCIPGVSQEGLARFIKSLH